MPEDIRARIETLLADARALIPSQLSPDRPPGKYTQGAPEWYRFEHRLWAIGEEIRQLMLRKTSLRKAADLQAAIVDISTNRNAKQGRQSFVMLLGYKCCRPHAAAVVSQLDDASVYGHVISTLLKMQASGFVREIRPFVEHDKTWIRNKATGRISRRQDEDRRTYHWAWCRAWLSGHPRVAEARTPRQAPVALLGAEQRARLPVEVRTLVNPELLIEIEAVAVLAEEDDGGRP